MDAIEHPKSCDDLRTSPGGHKTHFHPAEKSGANAFRSKAKLSHGIELSLLADR
jgi:hypothetical protein